MNPVDFERAFASVPGLYLLLRPDARFTIAGASDAYLRATHTERDAILGRALFDVFPDNPEAANPTGVANLRASLLRVLATRAPDKMAYQKYDIRRPASQGGGFEERYWSSLNSPVLSDDGEVQHIVHGVEDVTELVRLGAQEERHAAELLEANHRFQAMYDQGLFAGTLDLHGRVTDLNRSSLEQCGFTRGEMIGKPFWECGWWNRSPSVQAWVKAAVEQAIRGEPFRGESTYFWADGTERVVDFACMPIRDAGGNVQFVFPTGMDITERVQAERNLRATEILESIKEGFFALDRDWRFTYVNREAQRILGCDASELLGATLWQLYPGLIGSAFEPAYRRTMSERSASVVLAFYPDHDRWYEAHTYPTPGGMSIYFQDVTEQKRAELDRERLVAESEKQQRVYEAALSNTPDLVYVFGLDHRFVYANEALLRMWGKTRDEALGKNCLELGYEPWHATMHDREIEQVVATRAPIRGEVPFTGTNGRRIYDYIFVPVFGSDGRVEAVAGTTRDVTERQHVEQAIREHAEQLRLADRAKDEFLATLSHELRNPLAPLRNALELLRLSGGGTAANHVPMATIHEMMGRQVNLLIRLVDDLLEMSRIQRGTLTLRKEPVPVSSIVRSALEISDPLVRAAAHRLDVSMPDEPLWLEGDPVRLSQILANVLNNAAKYTDAGGSITLRVRRDGESVVIAVRDDGAGIAPDALPRLFQMFNRAGRSNALGEGGLGIGLALARRLVEMHGGSIDAFSEGLGKGSEFTVRLPLTPSPKLEVADARAAQPAMLSKRILVVDDNRDAVDSLSLTLKMLGADVRIARDGPEALEAFGHYDPSVVLLDIGMPGMDGYHVAREMRTRYPERRTVLIALTGWGQEKDRLEAREAGFDHHLTKPAEIRALQTLLASLEH